MLLLLFNIAGQRYGLNADQVVEVAPQVCLNPIPQAPGYIAGLFDYRGQPVPVIDLCQLINRQPCRACMTTRIIMLSYTQETGHSRILGLLAEQVTETVKRDHEALRNADISIAEAPWLGSLIKDSEGLLQLIEVAGLLPDSAQTRLFSAAS